MSLEGLHILTIEICKTFFYKLPVHIEGDSDSEFNNNGHDENINGGHDWPSATLDHRQALDRN